MSSYINPRWSTAPPWARYKAQDGDGTWYWYEDAPVPSGTGSRVWIRNGTKSRQQKCDAGDDDWNKTLERRP